MNFTGIQTPIVDREQCIEAFLGKLDLKLENGDIFIISSKVVGLLEGSSYQQASTSWDEGVKSESEYYVEPTSEDYPMYITRKHGLIVPNAGVDESNSGERYSCWPGDPYASCRKIWQYLTSEYSLSNLGVVLTDSTPSRPLQWGQAGKSLSYAGFAGISKETGSDLFGRDLKMTYIHHADQVAAAANLIMGESDSQTPIVVGHRIPNITFETPGDSDPSKAYMIDMDDDMYGPLLKGVEWKKGGSHPLI